MKGGLNLIQARKWLLLSVSTLLLAGLLTIIIVFSRTPGIKDVFFFKGFFNRALVAHVDLSQLFWFLSLGCFISIVNQKRQEFINKAIFGLIISAVFLIFTSCFIPVGTAILSNYVPVIDNFLFFLGLSLFLTAILLFSWHYVVFNFNKNNNISDLLIYAYHLIILIGFLNLILTVKYVKSLVGSPEYYEYLFWSFGHITQFAYVILMVFAWLKIFEICKIKANVSDNIIRKSIGIYVIIALASIFAYFIEFENLIEFKDLFTKQMIFGSSFLSIMIVFYYAKSLVQKKYAKENKENKVLLSAFFSSSLLFAYGGFLGLNIKESNTLIPAHYHGSVIGVTIALIGLVYYYMPKLKYAKINSGLAFYQPILYFSGQFIHITGLAISGGYGALRKSPDSIYGFGAKFWMGIMGIGGLITMIAGVIFFIICYKAIKNSKKT